MGNRSFVRISLAGEVVLVTTIARVLATGKHLHAALGGAASALGPGPGTRIVTGLQQGLVNGLGLTEAAQAVFRRIHPIHMACLRMVDTTGRVREPYERAATAMARRLAVRRKVAGAMVYPVFVMTMVVAGVAAIALFVRPRLAEIGLVSPGSTRATSPAPHWAIPIAGAVVILGVLACLGVWKAVREMQAMSALETFARGASLACAGGEDGTVAMRVGVICIQNSATAARLELLIHRIDSGVPPASERTRGTPWSELLQWVAVALETGRWEDAFMGLADALSTRLDRQLTRVTVMAEPALILLAGGVMIGGILTVVRPLLLLYGDILP